MNIPDIYDVIIVGGSYAGLSAALALGRSMRQTLVLDAGRPCNRTTPHSQNFLTQDGQSPAAIAALARGQVARYPTVHFMDGTAVAGTAVEGGFELQLDSGVSLRGVKLIFATGIVDELPDIPGFAECWGKSVIHCPYCHGYEFRGAPTALFANGERALHLAGLVRNLTDNLIVVPSGPAVFSDEQAGILRYHNIPVIETPVAAIGHQGGYINTLLLSDGTRLELGAMYAALPFHQGSGIPKKLGVGYTETGHIKTDAFQKTCVRGMFVCGDSCNPMRSVANAVASGNIAGAVANAELTAERFTDVARPAPALVENDCGC